MLRKRRINKSSDEILKEITTLDEKIKVTTEELKSLKHQKKSFEKDLSIVEKREAVAKEEAEMKELANLIKEKGYTPEQVKEILEKQ